MQIKLDNYSNTNTNVKSNNEKLNQFVSKANKKIHNKKIRFGQFLTSNEIASFMVNLSSISKEAKVLEPSAGKGVFIEELLRNGFKNITAIEYDKEFYTHLTENFKNINLICSDFLESNRDEKFDLIIGNPPYVQWNNIEPKIRLQLTESSFWKNYINGEWDIFYSFIIWSIEKLNDNGELIFIIPYNWFNSTHARSLRKYLISKGKFEIILHFGELKLFSDCFPNNIIFKFIKTNDDKKINVCDYNEKKANTHDLLKDINTFLNNKEDPFTTSVKCFKMENFTKPDMWFLGNDNDIKIIENIEESTKINNKEEYLTVAPTLNVGVGMVTGFDQAFIIEENELELFNDEEKKYIFKFVKAKNCKRFFVDNPSYYIFLDEIIDETELKRLPNIYNRLIKYKEKLEKRYMSKKKKWWHWATIRNLDLFKNNLKSEKIFIPCIDRSLKPRFSYTQNEFYGSGDVLMLVKNKEIREDIKFILAWLNSRFINKWYRIKGSKKGQRIQYTQSYVSKIPLRLINWDNKEEIEIYNKIIDLTNSILTNRDTAYEEKIDELFESLVN